VDINSHIDVQGVFAAGNVSISLNGAGGDGAKAVGGAYGQVNYTNTNRAYVAEGAIIEANTGASPVNVNVSADTSTQLVAITPTSGRGASIVVHRSLGIVIDINCSPYFIGECILYCRVNVVRQIASTHWTLSPYVELIPRRCVLYNPNGLRASRCLRRCVLRHSFDVDEFGVHAPIPSGQSSPALFKPEAPGTYTFYCAPHYDKATGRGMKGMLIVE
jgi:hypothetical protein